MPRLKRSQAHPRPPVRPLGRFLPSADDTDTSGLTQQPQTRCVICGLWARPDMVAAGPYPAEERMQYFGARRIVWGPILAVSPETRALLDRKLADALAGIVRAGRIPPPPTRKEGEEELQFLEELGTFLFPEHPTKDAAQEVITRLAQVAETALSGEDLAQALDTLALGLADWEIETEDALARVRRNPRLQAELTERLEAIRRAEEALEEGEIDQAIGELAVGFRIAE